MSDRRKKIILDGWPGGLFSIGNQRKASKAHLLVADNIVIDGLGSVRERPGIFAYGNYMADYIIGMIGPISVSAGFRYFSLKDKTLVQDSPVAVIHTYATGGRGQFAFFDNTYIHTNAVDTVQVWASGDAATANALGAPKSRVVHVHNDRVFMANGTTLYETAPGTAPNAAADNFATGATWAINPDDGDPIFGIGSIDRDLYIFKGRSVHVQSGYTVNERQTRVFDGKHGCTAPDSIQTVDLEGAGRALIFLDQNRKLCAIYGGSVHEIGEIVQNELDLIWNGQITMDTYPTNYNKHACVSAVHPEGYYLLGLSPAYGGAVGTFTTCLAVHLKVPYSGEYGTRWPITRWKYTSPKFGNEFNIRFGVMCYFDDLVRKSVAIPQRNEDGKYQLFVMENPPMSHDHDEWTSEGPIDYQIMDNICTVDLDAGDDMTYKNWCELVTHISSEDLSPTTVNYTATQINNSDSTVLSETKNQPIDTLGKDYACVTRLTDSSTRCRISISMGNSANIPQVLHGLEVFYTKGGSV